PRRAGSGSAGALASSGDDAGGSTGGAMGWGGAALAGSVPLGSTSPYRYTNADTPSAIGARAALGLVLPAPTCRAQAARGDSTRRGRGPCSARGLDAGGAPSAGSLEATSRGAASAATSAAPGAGSVTP